MYKYLQAHEKRMLELLASADEQDWESIRAYHLIQIGFIQHERLVHLIVTLAVAFIMLGAFVVSAFYPGVASISLDIILTILEIFYLVHYYRLENGVQRWYGIYNRICEKSKIGRSCM